MARILLVDDEQSILNVLSALLKTESYTVVPCNNGERAKEMILAEEFDLVISDIRMTPVDGLQILKHINQERPSLAVIMLTAFGSVETAIESLKLGAFDYVTKPFKVDELLITVKRALEYNKALTENVELKAQLGLRYQMENIVAESSAMMNTCEMIRKIGPTEATVLITGETGTGKELIAKAIHGISRRKEKNFLALNCAALPEALLESEMFGHVKGSFTGASEDKQGLFEAASGGTLFLDEIGSMPMTIQGKLLRVLQEKEVRKVGGNDVIKVDARVLAATNVNLEALIEEGKFRQDLFFRLSVIPIEIKALRDRVEDILPLVYHFLSPEVSSIFQSYSWPGNVRELENAIKHALTFSKGDVITKDVIPPKIAATPVKTKVVVTELDASKCKSLKAFLRSKEKEYLSQVLSKSAGDKGQAAKSLKISLATLYRKLPQEES
jgi:two-component system response regulator PilR (NtrC family)